MLDAAGDRQDAVVNISQLLTGFHDDRHAWAKFHGSEDVPPRVPVFVSSDTIELLAGGDIADGWTPYNAKEKTLFWHPVAIRNDMELGEFRFAPTYHNSGAILFSGGPCSSPQIKWLVRFPSEACVLQGQWQHVFLLSIRRSEMGAIYLEYVYHETILKRSELEEIQMAT